MNYVSVLFFFWNLQTVFLIKPLFSEGPSFFVLLVCNDASLNFRLQDVTLPASLSSSWPAKTAKKLSMSGIDILVLVLQDSNSFDLNAFLKFCLVYFLLLKKALFSGLIQMTPLCFTGFFERLRIMFFFLFSFEIFKLFSWSNPCFWKVLHFLYFLFVMKHLWIFACKM